MPELPEVETIARGLQEILPGRTIRRATLTARDLYRSRSQRIGWVRGARVDRVERIGKAIRVSFQGDRVMVVHLGMTGKFVVPGESGEKEALKHRHARFVFADGGELWYIDPRRFGYFYFGVAEGLRQELNMGPDPFEINARALGQILSRRTAPIKSLLLNQKLIAGLGNIYVDEILFLSSIHPQTPGRRVAADASLILRHTRAVLRRAIRYQGTTLRDYRRADGGEGNFQRLLQVYGRDGEPCRRCRSVIDKRVVGGRGTHFCPQCQRRVR